MQQCPSAGPLSAHQFLVTSPHKPGRNGGQHQDDLTLAQIKRCRSNQSHTVWLPHLQLLLQLPFLFCIDRDTQVLGGVHWRVTAADHFRVHGLLQHVPFVRGVEHPEVKLLDHLRTWGKEQSWDEWSNTENEILTMITPVKNRQNANKKSRRRNTPVWSLLLFARCPLGHREPCTDDRGNSSPHQGHQTSHAGMWRTQSV